MTTPVIETPVISKRQRIAELEAALEKSQAALKASEATKSSWYEKHQAIEAELEQVHALLDNLPGACGRKTEHEESYYRKDIKVVTRLAAWMASRLNQHN